MDPQDIAQYLADNPDFFERNPDLLAALQLAHPHSGQAISLVERQSMLLRERIKALEARVAEMLRHGQDNDVIADRLTHWTRALLLQADPARLPDTLVDELRRGFSVPMAALRLWHLKPEYAALASAQPASADTHSLADSMQSPYCGANVGFEAASWLADSEGAVQSMAMLPLRVGADPASFGLLVLGSADKDRFQVSMGTAFLERIAELASAALARLRA